MYTDYMIDIETLGKEPGCVVLSIGAVPFSRLTGEIGTSQLWNLDPVAQQRHGFTIDADTMMWWMRQADAARMSWASAEARMSSRLPGETMREVRDHYVKETNGRGTVWANSPSFDLMILRPLFERAKITLPWQYYQEADVRTLKLTHPGVEKVAPAIAHDAQADAIAQAMYVCACFKNVLT